MPQVIPDGRLKVFWFDTGSLRLLHTNYVSTACQHLIRSLIYCQAPIVPEEDFKVILSFPFGLKLLLACTGSPLRVPSSSVLLLLPLLRIVFTTDELKLGARSP